MRLPAPSRLFVGLLCILTFVLPALPPRAEADTPFPDMADSWYRYRESVEYLRGRDAIEGYPDGSFRPKQPINRAEFLKIVFRGRSDVAPGRGECFPDVDPDAWYSAYVCAAERRGIVKGYPDGSFKPEQTVNMAEAMKILLAAYSKEVLERQGQDWYESYTGYFARSEVLPRHAYLPWEELDRERAADLLARFLRFEDDRVLPGLSPGCGKAPPSSPPSVVKVRGVDRTFLATIPERMVSHDPAPLIVAFHGRTNGNEQVRAYYGLDKAADEFVIAYPAALSNGKGSFSWADPGDKPNSIRDIAFFDAIVENLASQYCIDMDRIFVVGHSLGAWMANTVACVRGDVVRGSATIGGDSVITDCAGPAAALLSHNPDDNLAPFQSTEKVRWMRTAENACQPETDSSEPRVLSCVKHRGCDGGNDVVWCPHEIDTDHRGEYYPHVWPRGFGESIVQFFRSLP